MTTKTELTEMQEAQNELDQRIASYFERNEDGGNYEERYTIAMRIAAKYNLSPDQEDQLNF